MSRHLLASFAALALLSGCGGADEGTNVVTLVETDNGAEFVVPTNDTVTENAVAGNSAEAAAPALNLAPDGLSLVASGGSARHATFGMARDVVVPMVIAALGKPTDTGRNEECGQGPLDFADFKGGLSLSFQDGKFVGWDLDGRDKGPYATAAGIGIGSTLKQMRDVTTVTVEESTLGTEFAAGGLGGLLSADAADGKVEHLWAGSICQFR
jgi:hypothetical protein